MHPSPRSETQMISLGTISAIPMAINRNARCSCSITRFETRWRTPAQVECSAQPVCHGAVGFSSLLCSSATVLAVLSVNCCLGGSLTVLNPLAKH
jgi:hypothetical protein